MDAKTERIVVVAGLVVAVAFGIAGGSVDDVDAETTLYAISSFGWIVATALLTVRHLGTGDRVAAAGFLLLTIAEPLLWVNGRSVDAGYADAFAGGAMGYSAGLLLVAIAATYPVAVRALALSGAIAWLVYLVRWITGSDLAVDDVNNLIGYVLLSAAFMGVAVVEYRGGVPRRQAARDPAAATAD